MNKKNMNEDLELIDISNNDVIEELKIDEANINVPKSKINIDGDINGKIEGDDTNNNQFKPEISNQNSNNSNYHNEGYSPDSIPRNSTSGENTNVNNSDNNVPNNLNNKQNSSNNSPVSQNGVPENNTLNNVPKDNRSLSQKAKDAKDKIKDTKDKIKDTKDKIKNTKDKIKNAPENIKNKVDDTKKKFDNAKDKVKNAPENLRKKREQVKNTWNNRPKSMKEAKEKAKNSLKSKGANLKNKAKNGIKNGASKAKQKTKEEIKKGAKTAFDNSKVGQAYNTAKDIIAFIKKIKNIKKVVTVIGIAAIVFGAIMLFGLIVSVVAVFIPGVIGDANNSYNFSQYSEIDQKTLVDLKDVYSKYPTADATLAITTVLYPYFSNLHGGNVTIYLSGTSGYNKTQESTSTDNSGKIVREESDDMYLVLFRNSDVIKRLEKLMQNMGTTGDTSVFEQYLKNTYFAEDSGISRENGKNIYNGYNGYKHMFNSLKKSSDEEKLKNAIIQDIYGIKYMFTNYIFENVNCSTTLIDAGTVDTSELLKGNVLVDLKKPGCSSLSMCSESYYDTYLTLEEYVKGVVYEEISGENNINKIAAQMVAAKTFTLSRRKNEIKTEPNTGAYVIPMLWSTADQDFCHIEKGCNSPDIKEHHGYNRPSNYKKPEALFHGKNRPAASEEKKALYEEAWELTKNVYIVNSDGTPASVSYYQGASCTPGTCMDQSKLVNYENTSFDSILAYFYSKYSIATVDGDFATVQVSSSTTCSSSSGTKGGIPDGDFKFYYQTDYASSPFCGSSNHVNSCNSGSNSICSSGCGVTSFAMLIENLSTGNVIFDPIAANEEARLNSGCAVGAGSNDSLFTQISKKHAGFSAAYLTKDTTGANKVIETIKNGGLVAANVQHNSPFTNGGHWILIRGITEDGKVKVADPISKDRSLIGTYDINEFIDKNWLVDKNGTTHSWIAIYGPRSEEIKKQFVESNLSSGEMIDDETALQADFVAPVQDSSLKMYGKNSANGNTNHDLGASCGTAVYAPADGTATFKTVLLNSKIAGYGNEVEIVTDDGYRFVLSHLKSFIGYNVLYGNSSTYPSSCIGKNCSTHKYGSRKVSKGEKIGESGTSGNSKGCHLHIELYKDGKRLEPSGYLGYGVE